MSGRFMGSARIVVVAVVAVAVGGLTGCGGGAKPAGTSAKPARAGRTSPDVLNPTDVVSTTRGLLRGRTIDLGEAPGFVTADSSGSVWASLPTAHSLLRIDPMGATTAVAVGEAPMLMAVGPHGIWVSSSSGPPLALLNAGSGARVLTAAVASAPIALAVDSQDGSVWAAQSDGTVTHFDTAGHAVGTPAVLRPAPKRIGLGEGWLWAVNGVSLTRVGTGLSPSIRSFDSGPAPIAMTFDQGVWTAHANGELTRFNPQTAALKVNTKRQVAPELDAVAAAEKDPSVWAMSAQTKALYQLSTMPGAPVTGRVTLASAPVGLAVVGRSVWVGTGDGKISQIRF